MFIWASIAKHAKDTRLFRVLCVFLAVQVLLAVPIGITLLRDPPSVLYPRVHGGPDFALFDRNWADEIEVTEDANGFASDISPSEISVEYESHYFIITPEYIFYKDANASLAIPTNLVSAWALREGNLEEIFDHLALFNRYFSSIVAPLFLMIFVVFAASQGLICLAAVWLFGYWQMPLGYLNVRERFAVCTFASVPAGILGFAIGIFLPIFHIFLFQFGMIYFSYKAMKEYWNA